MIRRHPDVKLLRRPEDIPALAAQQGAILDGLWPLLAPGGTLLYVTCSVLEAENSGVIAAFLARTEDAEPLPLKVGTPRAAGNQILPRPGGPDGLFFSLLQRRAKSPA